ncbi:hypothetical protein B0H10DRAFT_1951048 [Mycena sp. CBHHK59/15]|nr:hypothetical protein B0H10DRAFT_1951048 [Mycena sp. CBHHK59/15]
MGANSVQQEYDLENAERVLLGESKADTRIGEGICERQSARRIGVWRWSFLEWRLFYSPTSYAAFVLQIHSDDQRSFRENYHVSTLALNQTSDNKTSLDPNWLSAILPTFVGVIMAHTVAPGGYLIPLLIVKLPLCSVGPLSYGLTSDHRDMWRLLLTACFMPFNVWI